LAYKLALLHGIDDVIELRVLQWQARLGEAVELDDLLVELETHKVVVEMRAERAGFLRCILHEEGSWYKVGSVLAILTDGPDDPLPDDVYALPDYGAVIEIV